MERGGTGREQARQKGDTGSRRPATSPRGRTVSHDDTSNKLELGENRRAVTPSSGGATRGTSVDAEGSAMGGKRGCAPAVDPSIFESTAPACVYVSPV